MNNIIHNIHSLFQAREIFSPSATWIVIGMITFCITALSILNFLFKRADLEEQLERLELDSADFLNKKMNREISFQRNFYFKSFTKNLAEKDILIGKIKITSNGLYFFACPDKEVNALIISLIATIARSRQGPVLYSGLNDSVLYSTVLDEKEISKEDKNGILNILDSILYSIPSFDPTPNGIYAALKSGYDHPPCAVIIQDITGGNVKELFSDVRTLSRLTDISRKENVPVIIAGPSGEKSLWNSLEKNREAADFFEYIGKIRYSSPPVTLNSFQSLKNED